VALSTALHTALRHRDNCHRNDDGNEQPAVNSAIPPSVDSAAANTATTNTAGFTFRVLGKRSGVGHKGFSSDDLKRACAAALLKTNQANWAAAAAADVDGGCGADVDGVTTSAKATRSVNCQDRSSKAVASALACRLRRVNAPSSGARNNTESISSGSSKAEPGPNHLTFLARVHDTSFSFLLLLHGGTLSEPQGKSALASSTK